MQSYRKAYEEYLGFKIDSKHQVHHIDGDRTNNALSNLVSLPAALHKCYHMHEKLVFASEKGVRDSKKAYLLALSKRSPRVDKKTIEALKTNYYAALAAHDIFIEKFKKYAKIINKIKKKQDKAARLRLENLQQQNIIESK